jgi:hypothetical protein
MTPDRSTRVHHHRSGIALVAALITLAMVLALGTGAIFLAQSSLGLASNQRAHLMAKSAAEIGMESALVSLRTTYATANAIPATLTLPASPAAGLAFQLVEYTPLPASPPYTRARVIVMGTSGGTARYQTEAVFSAEPSTRRTFPVGLVSENVVQVNGNMNTIVNAAVHGNRGYSLDGNGVYEACDEGTGRCSALAPADFPVTAAVGMSSYECKASKPEYGGFCTSSTSPALGRRVAPVVVGTPAYETLRDELFGTPGTRARTPPCTVTTTSLGSSYTAGSVVCVTASTVTVSSSRSYSGVTIIVYGNLAVNNDLTLTSSKLLATGTVLNKSNLRLNSSDFFSNGAMTLEGNIFASGPTTIASGSSITIKGNIEHTYAGNSVGLLVMSKGDFRLEGNMEKNGVAGALVHAAVWAGGTAHVTGNLALRGGIASVGRLTGEGNAKVDGRATFDNANLPADRELRTATRR